MLDVKIAKKYLNEADNSKPDRQTNVNAWARKIVSKFKSARSQEEKLNCIFALVLLSMPNADRTLISYATTLLPESVMRKPVDSSLEAVENLLRQADDILSEEV